MDLKLKEDIYIQDNYTSLIQDYCDINNLDISKITHSQFTCALRYAGSILFSDRHILCIDISKSRNNDRYNSDTLNYDIIYNILNILCVLCSNYSLVFQDVMLINLLGVSSTFVYDLQFDDAQRPGVNISGQRLYREIKQKSQEFLKMRMLDDNTYAPKYQYMLNAEYGYDKTFDRQMIAQLTDSKTNSNDLLSKYASNLIDSNVSQT